jgi:hypothetical protein
MRHANFHPMPPRAKRGILRWILLFFHALPFVGLVFAYSTLAESAPAIFSGSLPWLIILIWAIVLLAHLLLVILLELREGIVFSFRERRRRKHYEAMHNENLERQKSRVRHLETRVYDEDDLEPFSGP